jgi:hypothetical protein
MPLQKIDKNRSASKRLAKSRRKRKFNKRKFSRSATLDSLDSLDSRTCDVHGEHEGKMNMDHMGLDRGREHNNTESREAQVIPFQHVDEWALFILLENKFGANKFKIEVSNNSVRKSQKLTLPQQTYEAFNVWAPGELGEEDIESCRL